MSETTTQPTVKKGVATRTVILLIIIAGLSAGAAAFAFANVSANTNNPTTANNLVNNYNGQWRPLLWHNNSTNSYTSFRAASTIANVSITGFSITNSNHITITLTYSGTGTTPAATIVVVAPGLTGSNTIASGWTSPTTVSISLVGTGSLTNSIECVRVLVVPLTGT